MMTELNINGRYHSQFIDAWSTTYVLIPWASSCSNRALTNIHVFHGMVRLTQIEAQS